MPTSTADFRSTSVQSILSTVLFEHIHKKRKGFQFLVTMIWRYSITINILAPWKQYLLSPIPHESFYRKHDTNLTMMALNWKCFEKWDSWQFPYSQLVLQLLKLLILIFCEVRCINVIALQIWYRRFFHKQSSSWYSNVKNGLKVKQLAKQPPTLKTLMQKALVRLLVKNFTE